MGPEADVSRALESPELIERAFQELYARARYVTRVTDLSRSVAVPDDQGNSSQTPSRLGHVSALKMESDAVKPICFCRQCREL